MDINKFNDTIDIWIESLSQFNIEQLILKPNDQSWSLGQVYQHLIDETKWYNSQIELTIGNEYNSRKSTSDAAKTLFKRGAFENKRFKGDSLISQNVKQPSIKAKLISGLEQLKKDTNDIWSKLKNSSKNGKSEHPGIGYLDGYEWIQYSEMHLRHHLKQKEQIENYLNSIQ